jgi:hypothetical protein
MFAYTDYISLILYKVQQWDFVITAMTVQLCDDGNFLTIWKNASFSVTRLKDEIRYINFLA